MDFLKLVKQYYFGSQCFKDWWSLYCAVEACFINVFHFCYAKIYLFCFKKLSWYIRQWNKYFAKKSKSRDIFRLSRNSKYIRRTWNCWKFCSTDRKQFFHNLELVFRIYKIHFVAKSNFAEQKLLMLILKNAKGEGKVVKNSWKDIACNAPLQIWCNRTCISL